MRVLITGASGFIGRHLTTFLLEHGHEVIGTYLAEGEMSVRGLPRDGVRWIRLDMQDRASVERVVADANADGIFHLAAQAYAQRAWKDPADTFRTNVLGTIYLYEALRSHPPKHGTLLAASGSAYGAPTRLPISEETPLDATNPYGVSKATQDMLSLQYSLNFGLRIVRARLFGTTGPGKTGDALNDFARQVARLEASGHGGAVRHGNLETRRDVSDIRDVMRAMWRVFESGKPTEPVNVGAGETHTIREIAETLVGLAKVPVELVPDPALLRPTDEPDNRADVRRLLALGYRPEFPFARTVADALDFWRGESASPPTT